VRVLHDHDRGVRNVDTDLDHGRGDEDVERARAERPHHGFLLGRLQLPVQQADTQSRELVVAQTLVLGRGRLRLDLVRTLDQRTDDVGLTTAVDLAAESAVGGGAAERRRVHDLGSDRRAAGRELAELGPIEIAVHKHGCGAGNGRGGHDEDVRVVALAPEQRALLDAEPMLLVDHDEPEPPVPHVPEQQRVRPDDDVDLAACQTGGEPAPTGSARSVGEQLDAKWPVSGERPVGRDTESSQHPPEAQVMLLGQHLGRSHEGALGSGLDGSQHRRHRDHRLARPHVTLQQAVHRLGCSQVLRDLVDGLALSLGELERQRLTERGLELARRVVPDAPTATLERALPGDKPHLHPEELVEDQASTCLAMVTCDLRAVDAAVRATPVDQPQSLADLAWKRIGEPAWGGPTKDLAHETMELIGEDLRLPGLWVDGDDGSRPLPQLPQDVDDRVGHLSAPPILVHATEKRRLGSGRELTLAPGLVEEDDRERRRAVAHDGFDERAPLACPPTRDPHHFAEHGHLVGQPEVGDRCPGGAVHEATRVVLKEIDHVVDVEFVQSVLEAAADPPELADGDRLELSKGERRVRTRLRGRGYSTPRRNG